MHKVSSKFVVKANFHITMNVHVYEVDVRVVAVLLLCLQQQLASFGCERWGDTDGLRFNVLSFQVNVVPRRMTFETYYHVLPRSLFCFQHWPDSMCLIKVVTEIFWHAKFLCHDFPNVLLKIFVGFILVGWGVINCLITEAVFEFISFRKRSKVFSILAYG